MTLNQAIPSKSVEFMHPLDAYAIGRRDGIMVSTHEWVKTLPTVEGQYWWHAGGKPLVVTIGRMSDDVLVEEKTLLPVRVMGGFWAGPLTPPA